METLLWQNAAVLRSIAYERLLGSEYLNQSLRPIIPPNVCTCGQLTSYLHSWRIQNRVQKGIQKGIISA